MAALVLLTAGCTHGRPDTGTPLASPALPAQADSAVPGHWWRNAGDPVLSQLVEQGLAGNQSMQCEALALQKAATRAEARAGRIDIQIKRLFDTKDGEADSTLRLARAYRHAGHRAALAAKIASEYIEARRLQEVLALRETLQSQFNDNAEIAAFRREAGLVPGIDTGLAGSLQAVTTSELDALRTRYAKARAALAESTGMDGKALEQLLGQNGQVPDIAAQPVPADTFDPGRRADLRALRQQLAAQLIRKGLPAALLDAEGDAAESAADEFAQQARTTLHKAKDQAEGDAARLRDALASATARESSLAQKAAQARNTAEDARLAYRNGTEGFATLFVAEAAALALAEARVTARADVAKATIRLWTGLGGGWENADLAPDVPPQDPNEVLVCE